MLTASYNEGVRTPLGTLKSVISHTLVRTTGPISTSKIVTNVEENWGLKIPAKVVSYSMSQLIYDGKAQRIIAEKKGDDDLFEAIISDEIRSEIKRQEAAAREQYSRLTKAIQEEIHRENLQRKFDASELLEEWLDKGSIAFLSTNYSSVWNSLDRKINTIIVKALNLESYEDNEYLNDLTDVALGDAIYRSLKELTEYEAESQNTYAKRNLTVYLDTMILSRAFGFLGPFHQESTVELLKMAHDLGYPLKAFDHTVDELQEIILAASSGFSGPMLEYALSNGLEASDLIELSQEIPILCQQAGIEIVAKPDFSEQLGLDEIELESQIEHVVKQANPRARQRDVDSLTSIFRLREGRAMKSLDSSNAIFITHNSTLQAVAHKFFKKYFEEKGLKNIVQLCMTDNVFSSRLWVKLPTTANWKPKAQIVAFALGHLVPSPKTKSAFLDKIRSLANAGRIDEKTAFYLSVSRFSDQLIALEYDGVSDFEDAEIKNIATDVLAKISRDIKAAKESGRREGLTAAEKEMKIAQDRYGNKSKELSDLEQSLTKISRDFEISKAASIKISTILTWIIFLLIFAGLTFGAMGLFNIRSNTYVALFIYVGNLFLFLLTWKGISASHIRTKIEGKIERIIVKRISRNV